MLFGVLFYFISLVQVCLMDSIHDLNHPKDYFKENEVAGGENKGSALQTEKVEGHSRQKRFVYINVQTPVDIGFLITIPYSFALPTFNLQTSRRFRKSIDEESELLANLTSDEILPKDSFDEPGYSIELRKLSAYFAVLQINEDICQQKIICEVFADPDHYQPLTSILGKKLIEDHGPVQENYNSRYYRYVKAMQQGVTGGGSACKKEFNRCPYSAHDKFNMQALHFWSFLTSTLQMEFKDEMQ